MEGKGIEKAKKRKPMLNFLVNGGIRYKIVSYNILYF